ncbi:hypothetical protein CXK92_20900 [Stutzerimonas stutzeri]|uniref:Uncharacterized protein n=1 Tax=Stutzerimonas stutzeri TaxID=316 RepID=A0A2N8RWL3_STUST|nr:hypothetical protein CXK92_20900 [Stutzerimonas stutzeri]
MVGHYLLGGFIATAQRELITVARQNRSPAAYFPYAKKDFLLQPVANQPVSPLLGDIWLGYTADFSSRQRSA